MISRSLLLLLYIAHTYSAGLYFLHTISFSQLIIHCYHLTNIVHTYAMLWLGEDIFPSFSSFSFSSFFLSFSFLSPFFPLFPFFSPFFSFSPLHQSVFPPAPSNAVATSWEEIDAQFSSVTRPVHLRLCSEKLDPAEATDTFAFTLRVHLEQFPTKIAWHRTGAYSTALEE